MTPKLLGEGNAQVKKAVEEMRVDIAREYEKSIYVLQFLVCEEGERETKVKENDYGLTEEDFQALNVI